jgi:excisionase family DNA binding protein
MLVSSSAADWFESYLSPSEYAELTGFSIATVQRYLDAGKLPKHQPGGPRSRIGIPRSALALNDGAPADTCDANALDQPPESQPEGTGEPSARRYGPRPRWQSQHNK